MNSHMTLSDKEKTITPRGRVTRLFIESRRVFYLAFFLTAMIELLLIAPILYMMNIMDRVMTSRSTVTLISLTLILIAVYIVDNSIAWLRRRLLTHMALRLDWDLAPSVFDAAFRNYSDRQKLNIQQVIGDMSNLRRFFQGRGFVSLVEAPFFLVFALLCLLLHPWLAVYGLVSSFLMVLLAILKARSITPLIKEASRATSESARSATEIMRHAEAATALGMQTRLRTIWYRQHQNDLVLSARSYEISGMVGAFSEFVAQSSSRLGMGLAAYLAICGQLSSGMVIGAVFILRHTSGLLQALINQWPSIVRARMAVERLDRLLKDDEVWKDRMPLPAPLGRIQVQNLTVMPSRGRRLLLEDISFSLSTGQVLAIIGPSAAGKTTLVRHLIGVVAPSSGSVRLDDVEISDWMNSGDIPHIGYVPQDVMTFEGTIAQNIARMEVVDSQAVVRAAELVDLHRSILDFPDGYDTDLGPGGLVLTGGQKQRLAIARALYRDPRFVVLDEPSSSLDIQSEEALLRLIRILKSHDVTVIITTHRLNLVEASDLVLALDRGRMQYFGRIDVVDPSILKSMVASDTTDGETTDSFRRGKGRRQSESLKKIEKEKFPLALQKDQG